MAADYNAVAHAYCLNTFLVCDHREAEHTEGVVEIKGAA